MPIISDGKKKVFIAWVIAGCSIAVASLVMVSHIIYIERDRENLILEASASVCANKSACPIRKPDCSGYIEEAEKWIKNYEVLEDKYMDCTRDLANCQNESNADILCIEPYCE